MSSSNPYRPPVVGSRGKSDRPAGPKVIGILSILFGAFGMLSIPLVLMTADMQTEFYETMGLSATYLRYSQYLSAASSVWLLITGIGLLRYKSWGRTSFNIYAAYTIVMTLVMSAYTITHLLNAQFENEVARAGAVGGAFGSLVGLVFPVLGLVFLNQSKTKEALH